MFQTEDLISKEIVTQDYEDEFQIRYIRYENVGLITTRSGKSYLILDSIDYWYDLIQDKYPAKQKCRCKNDYFKLCFNYIPRIGTDDYKAVELVSCCTECRRQRKFGEINIDYSPTVQLFNYPITYCKQPKVKYKLQSINGYWKEDAFYDLISFLSQRLLIYSQYKTPEKKWAMKRFDAEELKQLMMADGFNHMSYLRIYFSMKPLEELFDETLSAKGLKDLWRKAEVIQVNHPLIVAGCGDTYRYFYSIDCCSEYIDAWQVKKKGEAFCGLIKEFLQYSKERTK